MRFKRYLASIILSTFLVMDLVLATGLLKTERRIPGRGSVVVSTPSPPPPVISLSLFWDESCTEAVTEIMWGEMRPGGSRTVSFYVINDGEIALMLSMNTIDWTPVEAEQYFSLSWNAEGAALAVGELRLTKMTLTVSMDITGIDAFSQTIIIIGTET